MSSLAEFNTTMIYCTLFVGAAGFLGNILMFIVFTKRRMRQLTVSTYFRVMAITNILINFYWIKVFFLIRFAVSIDDYSDLVCKLFNYILYVTSPLSAWFLAAAGLDRFLTIIQPIKFKLFRARFFPNLVVLSILTFNICLYIYVIIEFRLVSDVAEENTTNVSVKVCDIPSASTITDILDLTDSSILPFILMTFSAIATFMGVYTSHKRMTKFVQVDKIRKAQLRDIKFGFSMLILNVVFLVLNTPYPIFYMLEFFGKIGGDDNADESNLESILLNVFLFWNYLFYSIQFYLQVATNSLVRRELFSFFRKEVFSI